MLYNDSLKVYIRKGGTVVVPLFFDCTVRQMI